MGVDGSMDGDGRVDGRGNVIARVELSGAAYMTVLGVQNVCSVCRRQPKSLQKRQDGCMPEPQYWPRGGRGVYGRRGWTDAHQNRDA